MATAKYKKSKSASVDDSKFKLHIDIPQSDHSQLIGKGGIKVKILADVTRCRVHFSNSYINRKNEKMNKVNLYGEEDAVEAARKKLRKNIMFCYNFGLLTNFYEEVHEVLKKNNMDLQEIVYNANKQEAPNYSRVAIKTRNKHLHGCDDPLAQEMQKLAEKRMISSSGYAILHVAPVDHKLMMGREDKYLKVIIKRTGAEIRYGAQLDSSDNYLPEVTELSSKESTILISGTFQAVASAWQELLKFLPSSLQFWMPGQLAISTKVLQEIGQRHSTYIKRRMINSNWRISICGPEKNIKKLYISRREVIQLYGSQGNTRNIECFPVQRNSVNNPDSRRNKNECRKKVSDVSNPEEGNVNLNGFPPVCFSQLSSNNIAQVRGPSQSPPNAIKGAPINGFFSGKQTNQNESNFRHTMGQKTNGHFRSPFKRWFGKDFLQSMLGEEKAEQWWDSDNDHVSPPEGTWTFARSNLPESHKHASLDYQEKPCAANSLNKELTELLTSTPLRKYKDLFQAEEIDLEAFPLLKEYDLWNLGIDRDSSRMLMDAIKRREVSPPKNLYGNERCSSPE